MDFVSDNHPVGLGIKLVSVRKCVSPIRCRRPHSSHDLSERTIECSWRIAVREQRRQRTIARERKCHTLTFKAGPQVRAPRGDWMARRTSQ